MKVAIISDIHGNHISFMKCLNEIKKFHVEKIFFLGDAVGYLPGTCEVLDLLKDVNAFCIKGNHEAMLLGQLIIKSENEEIYKLQKARESLSEDQLLFIKHWPYEMKMLMDNKLILMVHGSPFENTTGYVYPNDNLSKYNDINADVIFMGHTHIPFVREEHGKLFVNVGSVGLPRDVGFLSSFCIYDTICSEAKIYRFKLTLEDLLKSKLDFQKIHPFVLENFKRNKSNFEGIII